MAALLAQGRAVFFRGCLIGVGQPRFFYSSNDFSRLVNAEKELSLLTIGNHCLFNLEFLTIKSMTPSHHIFFIEEICHMANQ